MSLYTEILENLKRIDEITYSRVLNKQRSITRLFPTFFQRVKAISANGGIRLVQQLPEVWKFKVVSGTQYGKSYDVYLRFKNVKEVIRKFIGNKKLWKKDGTGINLNLLAPEVFNKVDLEIDCTCPADSYWGSEYIKTQRQAQYGKQELRAPKIRNPKQYGIMCKHSHDVFQRLPFYTSTFASWLKSFYKKDIDEMVKEVLDKQKNTQISVDNIGQ